jgi:hypothetical protein
MSIKTRQVAGERGRCEGLLFEKKLRDSISGKNVSRGIDIFNERLTTPKTDIIFHTKISGLNNDEKISLKNPKTKSTPVQIQLCSVDRFNKLFKTPEHIVHIMNPFFGNDLILSTKEGCKNNPQFKNICNKWGVEYNNLNSKNEIRRCRVFGSNIPKFEEFIDWINHNKRQISEFVLSTGFNDATKHPETVANIIAFASKKNDLNSIEKFTISDILEKIAINAEVKLRNSNTVIEIGPITLQMKGSGKGAGYHYMQFNMSLSDLKKFMNQEE